LRSEAERFPLCIIANRKGVQLANVRNVIENLKGRPLTNIDPARCKAGPYIASRATNPKSSLLLFHATASGSVGSVRFRRSRVVAGDGALILRLPLAGSRRVLLLFGLAADKLRLDLLSLAFPAQGGSLHTRAAEAR
jgi:hypothetical protein